MVVGLGVGVGERIGIRPGDKVPDIDRAIHISSNDFEVIDAAMRSLNVKYDPFGISVFLIEDWERLLCEAKNFFDSDEGVSKLKEIKGPDAENLISCKETIDQLGLRARVWSERYSKVFLYGL